MNKNPYLSARISQQFGWGHDSSSTEGLQEPHSPQSLGPDRFKPFSESRLKSESKDKPAWLAS
jgi:hypothetical protein